MGGGSGVAVSCSIGGSCSSDWTPSLGTSICQGYGPKKKKEERKQESKKARKKERNGRKEDRQGLEGQKLGWLQLR